MKKPYFAFLKFIIPTILCLVLASCSKANTNPPLDNKETTVNQNNSSSPEKEIIMYLDLGEFAPLSYIKDGEQKLTGFQDNPELLNSVPKYSEKNCKNISIDTMYSADTKTKPIFKSSNLSGKEFFKTIASNTTYNVFPIKVRYEKYTLENQPTNTVWINYFKDKLQSSNTPIIITESWFFDWDNNGKEEAILNAGNLLYPSEDFEGVVYPQNGKTPPAQNPPAQDNSVIYTMSALFMDGKANICLEKNTDIMKIDINNSPLGSSNSPSYSYVKPEKSDYSYEYFSNAITLDKNNNLIQSPVYADMTGASTLRDLVVNYMYLLCDIDNDGVTELVSYIPTHNSHGEIMAVYKLENGKITCTFSSIVV